MPVTAVYFMLTTVLLFLKFKATENTVIKVEFVNLAFIVAFKALFRYRSKDRRNESLFWA